ncbi:hypothetical protein ARMGADRAFT_1020114 [Armillaria gallica]|uniref:Protein kinase domain-containing protein n=1 Tax=Armillaria gallica TaxID=47427 RepID=A0A2H3CK92_ARMGA|nr:hypothetical protein ARMGADRAFT_1020114 [Armillaria gallica]
MSFKDSLSSISLALACQSSNLGLTSRSKKQGGFPAKSWKRSALSRPRCVLHNDIHIGNIILREKIQSPVTIDFGQADIREPELSDEEWWSAVRGAPDTRYMRRLLVNPENGPWKRTVMLYEMSNPHYKDPLVSNR